MTTKCPYCGKPMDYEYGFYVVKHKTGTETIINYTSSGVYFPGNGTRESIKSVIEAGWEIHAKLDLGDYIDA